MVRRARDAQQGRPDQANAISVRLELQADCLAGVWGHTTTQRDILESGDADEALAAASAIGDDRIQRGGGAGVNPETWTHGSSGQRVSWFKRGFTSGRKPLVDVDMRGDDAHRMTNVTGIVIPDGVDGEAVRLRMRAEFEIEIGAAFGPLQGRIWRIGAMGYNAMKHKVAITMGALETVRRAEGFATPAGAGVDAVLEAWR